MAIVLEYLTKQNRPYSVTDIVTNLHNSMSKVVATKALVQLETAGSILAKTYGKSAIYVIKQVSER